MHIHVEGPSGEAKVWLEPSIETAENHGLAPTDLRNVDLPRKSGHLKKPAEG